MNDEKFGKVLDSTIANLQSGTKGLSDNMDAVKSNILLKGYYNKKKKTEAKKNALIKAQQLLKLKKDSTNVIKQ